MTKTKRHTLMALSVAPLTVLLLIACGNSRSSVSGSQTIAPAAPSVPASNVESGPMELKYKGYKMGMTLKEAKANAAKMKDKFMPGLDSFGQKEFEFFNTYGGYKALVFLGFGRMDDSSYRLDKIHIGVHSGLQTDNHSEWGRFWEEIQNVLVESFGPANGSFIQEIKNDLSENDSKPGRVIYGREKGYDGSRFLQELQAKTTGGSIRIEMRDDTTAKMIADSRPKETLKKVRPNAGSEDR